MLKRFVLFSLLILTLNWNVNAASTLHIGFGASNPCATGCGGHPNTNPNGYALSANFDIFQNGSKGAQQPILLILGVAGYQDPITDPGRFSQSSITGITTYNPYNAGNLGNGIVHPSTAWTYGSTAFGVHGTQTAGNGYQGFFTSGDAYSFLNLGGSGVNASQNITNWNAGIAAYSPTAPTPAGYEMYVFALNIPLSGKGLVDITFATDPATGNPVIPAKTYILAYGLDTSGKPLAVPFTESGLQTPEPSAVILMSSVMVALILILRRRKAACSVKS
jgi:hypothetical protein